MIKRILRKLTPAGMDWQSIVFFMFDLQRGMPPLPPKRQLPPLKYHIINAPEDPWLTVLCEAQPQHQLHLRMIHGGQQCYIAILNGEWVAYAWITSAPCHVSEINFDLPIGPACIYIYDCFVRADCRGLGIYKTLLLKIVGDFRLLRWPRYYEVACIGAEPENTASVRGIRHAGFEEFARIRYLRLWKHSRWYGVRELVKRMSATGTIIPLND